MPAIPEFVLEFLSTKALMATTYNADPRDYLPGLSKRYSTRDSKILSERGHFGMISTAFDTKLRKQVAVKRIKNVWEFEADLVKVLKLIKSMKLLSSHPHVSSPSQVLRSFEYWS